MKRPQRTKSISLVRVLERGVDGIYWGDDEEGVRFYLDVTGVSPGQITKALEQVAQEGTSIIYHKASTRLFTEVG